MAVTMGPAPKVPTVFPLSKDQQSRFDFYTSDSFLIRLCRDYLFISKDTAWRGDFLKKTITGGGIGGLIGGVSTYVALTFLGSEEESKKDDTSTLKITGFGTGLGAVVGALFGATHTLVRMEKSKEYLAWKDNAIKTHVYPLFQEFLKKTPPLDDLVCDITFDLISHPVRAPNGRTYEKAAIEEWLSNQAIKYPSERLTTMSPEVRESALLDFCPRRSCHLTSDMLVYDFEYHQKVAVALKFLLDQQINAQFAQGLLSYRVAMFKDRETLMNEIVREVTAKFTAGTITENEFIEACRACRAHYGLQQ